MKDLGVSIVLDILYNHEDLQGGHDDYWLAYRFVEKSLKALEIIKVHKLLNYVIKNQKCATMYHLSIEDLNILKEIL